MIERLNVQLSNADTSMVNSRLGVKIHGYLMSNIDTEYSRRLHEMGVNPFSLFIVPNEKGYMLKISTLSDEARQITEFLNNADEIIVKGSNSLKIIEKKYEKRILYDDYIRDIKKYRLNICTPAVCKKNGSLYFGTDILQYFKSVMIKLNEFEDLNITENDITAAFETMSITDYNFCSRKYVVEPKSFKGMVGNIDFTIKKENEASQLLRMMLNYASYAGIGSRTALGMGGCRIEMKLV